MINIVVGLNKEGSPVPSFTSYRYCVGINEENYVDEIFKLLSFIKDNGYIIEYFETVSISNLVVQK